MSCLTFIPRFFFFSLQDVDTFTNLTDPVGQSPSRGGDSDQLVENVHTFCATWRLKSYVHAVPLYVMVLSHVNPTILLVYRYLKYLLCATRLSKCYTILSDKYFYFLTFQRSFASFFRVLCFLMVGPLRWIQYAPHR